MGFGQSTLGLAVGMASIVVSIWLVASHYQRSIHLLGHLLGTIILLHDCIERQNLSSGGVRPHYLFFLPELLGLYSKG